MAQMQLLQIPLDTQDEVYTPDCIARDMVEFFKPHGRILEPCKGDGVFLKYLPPSTSWCEINEGRDFFAWHTPVDWCFGNPPYKQFYEFMEHSYSIATNIVYLLPVDKPFNVFKTLEMIFNKGRIVHARYYGDGRTVGIPEIHRPATAFHFQKGYFGPMYSSMAETCLTLNATDRALPEETRRQKPSLVSASATTGANTPGC